MMIALATLLSIATAAPAPAPAAPAPAAPAPATPAAPAPETSAGPTPGDAAAPAVPEAPAAAPEGEVAPEGEAAEGEAAEGEAAPEGDAMTYDAAPVSDAEIAPMSSKPERSERAVELPRRRGIGLMIAGGVLGLAGFPLKIVASSSDRRVAREIDSGVASTDDCVESCYVGPLFNVIAAPLLVTSAGLVGGGLGVHGRWLAHRDVARGRPDPLVRTRALTGVGLGLVGAGVVTFVASRIVLRGPQASASATGYVSIRELGWWGGILGVYVGSGLAGHAMGYRSGRRAADPRLRAQLAPMLSLDRVGVSISGRF